MADEPEKSNKLRWVASGVVIILFLIIGCSYGQWLKGMVQEKTKSKANALFSYDSGKDDSLDITATVVSVDPAKGEMQVRLECALNEALQDPETGGAAHPIDITVNAVSGKGEHHFKKGDLVGPIDFVTSIEGRSFEYPNDVYKSSIEVGVFAPQYEDEKPSKDAAPTSLEVVAVDIDGYATAGGFRVSKTELTEVFPKGTKEIEDGIYRVALQMQRTDLVQWFAKLIICLQWLLALSAVSVAFSVVVWGRKAELALFTWTTAMLFALPPMRNIMVGAPPIGVYIDFLGFLCCETLVACALTSIVVTWLWRKA